MRKGVLCLLSLLGAFAVNRPLPERDLRLVRWNDTTTEWIPRGVVDSMAKECGASDHGGFIDVTETPNLHPNNFTQSIPRDFPAPSHEKEVKSFFGSIDPESIKGCVSKLISFGTRYYTSSTGVQAAEWIRDQFNDAKPGSASLFKHSWAQPSVVARFPGKTADAQVVVIGAHEDSIAGGTLAPGGDDDASGVCVLIETFKALAKGNFVPDRTIEFHTYAAEEVGLRGSAAIANNYQDNQVSVYSMLQMDMTLYSHDGKPECALITDYTDSSLTSFVGQVIKAYTTLPVTSKKCGYGCSDHASWTLAGYASAFPFEALPFNPNIHTTRDTLNTLNVVQGVEFVKIAIGYLVELGLTN